MTSDTALEGICSQDGQDGHDGQGRHAMAAWREFGRGGRRTPVWLNEQLSEASKP